MSADHVDFEALEAYALGELRGARGAQRGAEIEEHARACAECGQELRLLRAERALVHKRAAAAPPLSPALWPAVQAQVDAAKVVSLRRSFAGRARWLGAAAGVAAAAAVVLSILPGHRAPVVERAAAEDEEAARAADDASDLKGAEAIYREAFSVLEADVARAAKKDPEGAKRVRASLEEARAHLALASNAAGDDPSARLRVISGYAATLRSLQRAVDSEEMSQ